MPNIPVAVESLLEREVVNLTRDCEAHVIPFGSVVTVREGMPVTIEQTLGGNFTVNMQGSLLRIDAKDADALGKEVAQVSSLASGSLEEQVWEQLKTCYDPEIPVNIVDLGLIYDCQIIPLEEGVQVAIAMTLTAPGCGMGPVLTAEVEKKMKTLPTVKEATVQMIFDPPWDQSRLSEVAKVQLGLC